MHCVSGDRRRREDLVVPTCVYVSGGNETLITSFTKLKTYFKTASQKIHRLVFKQVKPTYLCKNSGVEEGGGRFLEGSLLAGDCDSNLTYTAN